MYFIETKMKLDRKHRSSTQVVKETVHESYLQLLQSDMLSSAPQPPQNLVIVATGSTTVDLDWDDHADADTFTVYVKNVATGATVQTITGIVLSEAEVMGLTGETEYEFWVTAVRDDIESPESNHVTTNTEPLCDLEISSVEEGTVENEFSLLLNGVDHRLNVPVLPAQSSGDISFTVESWIKWDGSVTSTIWGCQSAVSGGSIIELRSDGLRVRFGTLDQTGLPTPTIGQWVHFAVTYDGTTVFVYFDGVQVASFTGSSGSLFGGGRQSFAWFVSGREFGGGMDEWRLWQEVRTQSEIQENMNKKLVGDELNLFGWWELDDGEGEAPQDSSINENHADTNTSSSNLVWSEDVPDVSDVVHTVEATSSNDPIEYSLWQANESSLQFDGVDDFVSIGESVIPPTTDWTIEFRFFLEDNGANRQALSSQYQSGGAGRAIVGRLFNEDADDWNIDLGGSPDGWGAVGNPSPSSGSPADITADQWERLAISNIDGTLHIVINGVNEWTIDEKNTIGDFPFFLGMRGDGAEFFKGWINEVRVWDHGRTEAQILADNDKKLIGTEPGLVSLYKFEDGSGTTLTDYAGTKDGTIDGATWAADVPSAEMMVVDWQESNVFRRLLPGLYTLKCRDTEGCTDEFVFQIFSIDENEIVILDDENTETFIDDGLTKTVNNGIHEFEKVSDISGSEETRFNVDIPSSDFIQYISFRADAPSDTFDHIHICIGDTAAARIYISLGYNWTGGGGQVDTISCLYNSNSTVLFSNYDFTTDFTRLAIHYDSRWEQLNIYHLENDGTYSLLARLDGAFPGADNIRVFCGNQYDVGDKLYMEYWQVCYPNFIAIGDSITQGATLFDPDLSASKDNYESTWMRYADFNVFGVRNKLVVNKGVGGENSSEIDSRIATDIVAHQPYACFLHFSSNDFGDSVTYSQRSININSSISSLVSAGIKAFLLNSIYPNDDHANYSASTEYYVDYMTDASGFEDLIGYEEFIDIMHPDCLGDDTLPFGELAKALAQSDGIHPNIAGYEALAAAINDAINS